MLVEYLEDLSNQSNANNQVDGGVDGLVVKGFIDGDPLVDAAGNVTDPTPMINLLADVGYPIAPGMTDMLVVATGGTSVNMNQATKELINCLRSVNTGCNEECVCTETIDVVVGPWSVEDGGPNELNNCDYNRNISIFSWQVGKYPDSCEICDAGSETSPILQGIVIQTTEIAAEEGECPDQPY